MSSLCSITTFLQVTSHFRVSDEEVFDEQQFVVESGNRKEFDLNNEMMSRKIDSNSVFATGDFM